MPCNSLCNNRPRYISYPFGTIDQGISQILLETDSSILVEALQSCSYDFSANGVLFREAKFLMSLNFSRADIVHVPRSCNKGAHDLAHVGLNWVDLMFGSIPS